MLEESNSRIERLRNTGHKLTNARLTVLRALENHDGHMTSTDVLEAVTRMDPEIGRASVFRALDLFTQLSIIRPTYIDSSVTPTYVLMPGGHHHHIICTNCNRVIEFEECKLDQLEAELERKLHVRLTGHLLEFYGLCESCQDRAKSDS
ncbi:MAG: transcriptional repressor [Anaerolineae bacterium]|nr:transcriptional repressor [Anaerolineae bacterium]